MKKIISFAVVWVLAGNTLTYAQNGRPEKIGGNAPNITARNSVEKDVASLREQLNTLEKRIIAMEGQNNALKVDFSSLKSENAAIKADNSLLKAENAEQKNELGKLNTAQKANYVILDNAISKLHSQFNSQIGDFRITGFISNKSLGTSGAVSLLMGSHQ